MPQPMRLLVPRDVASRAAKERCDAGYGVGTSKMAVYLDFAAAIERYGKQQAGKLGEENADNARIIVLGKEVVKEKYGNLFEMYEKITGENPYEVPMRIYPAVHYTMGGLWVDYELMTNIPGLYSLGEANFSDHGANRLGASALMQGSDLVLPLHRIELRLADQPLALGEAGDSLGKCALVIVKRDRHRASRVSWGTASTH